MLHLSRLNFLLFSTFILSTFFFIHHLPTTTHTTTTTTTTTTTVPSTPTTINHLLFSIASTTNSLPHRLPYIHLYHPFTHHTFLFLPTPITTPTTSIPIIISSPTSQFPYSFPHGLRSAIRIARIIKESFLLSPPNIRWFIFGDDDTLFFPPNLVTLLSNYDHNKMYYIGSRSESLEQNLKMSFDMAYGGGGFAISAPLAKALSRVLDSCLMRYPHLYGSDARISSCVYELGVRLTIEPGFHQLDVRGNVHGLLSAHPLTPLLSLHHLDIIEPFFPHMNRTEAAKHLFKGIHVDAGRVLQQTVCYGNPNNITVSIAWGYAVEIYEGNLLLPELLKLQRTFSPWRRRGVNDASKYVFDTRDYPQDPCKRPTVFFMEDVTSSAGNVWSKYARSTFHSCDHADVIRNLKNVKVSTKKLQQGVKEVMTPRRECCDIVQPIGKSMLINIRSCGFDELIAMNV